MWTLWLGLITGKGIMVYKDMSDMTQGPLLPPTKQTIATATQIMKRGLEMYFA